MDQVEIDIVEAEARETSLERPAYALRREILPPHFGGDVELIARHARRPEGTPDRLLVAIHLGCVDVAVAQGERLLDGALARRALEPERAEPEPVEAEASAREGFLHHSFSPPFLTFSFLISGR